MASRMDRYRNSETSNSSRSSRNKNLYNTMYSFDRYSNIEGVASMDNSNQVDISKVKELLESREKYQRERQYRRLSSEVDDDLSISRKRYEEDTDRSYDVNDVLKSAKEKKEPDNKERVLNNTNYDILKKLNLKSEGVKDDLKKEEDLKELIETIANTSMLNKSNDEDINMFNDLVSDDTKVGDVKDITEFIDKKEKTMDDSFFTHSVKIKKADFVGSSKKGGGAKKFFITLFVLLLLASIVCFVLYYLGILKV